MHPQLLTWHLHFASVHSEEPLPWSACIASTRHLQHVSCERCGQCEGAYAVARVDPNESWWASRPVHVSVSVKEEHVRGRRADGEDALERVTLDNSMKVKLPNYQSILCFGVSMHIPTCLEAGHVPWMPAGASLGWA